MKQKLVLALFALCMSMTMCENFRNDQMASMNGSELDNIFGKPSGDNGKPKPTEGHGKPKPTCTSTDFVTCTKPGDDTCATSQVVIESTMLIKPSESLAYTTLTEFSTVTVTPTVTTEIKETITAYTSTLITTEEVTSPFWLPHPVVETSFVETDSVSYTHTTTIPITSTILTTATQLTPSTTITVYDTTFTHTDTIVLDETTGIVLVTTVVIAEPITATYTHAHYTTNFDISLTDQTTTKTEQVVETDTTQLIFSSAPDLQSAQVVTSSVQLPTEGTTIVVSFTETRLETESAPEKTLTLTSTTVDSQVYTVTTTRTSFTNPILPTTTVTVVTSVSLLELTDLYPVSTDVIIVDTVTRPGGLSL